MDARDLPDLIRRYHQAQPRVRGQRVDQYELCLSPQGARLVAYLALPPAAAHPSPHDALRQQALSSSPLAAECDCATLAEALAILRGEAAAQWRLDDE